MFCNGRVVAVVLVSVVATWATAAGAAIIAGQVDTFENGSVQSWQSGVSNPNPATNVATGGPAGAGDNYIRLTSNGGSAGGKLVAFNMSQWSGNYRAAGVNAIQMQVNNQGGTDLTLRLILFNGLFGQSLTTVNPVQVPAGSGWRTVSFPLASSNLSGGNYDTVMGTVTELNLVHAPSVISGRSSSPNIVAQLGVDNITAVVPEPGPVGLAAMGILIGLGARRRGGARRSAAGSANGLCGQQSN